MDGRDVMPATPAIVGAVRELRLALPVAFDDMVIGAFALARSIEVASAGRYTVAVQRITVTGLEAVVAGDADLYLAAEHQHATYHPALVAFAGLPTGEHLDVAAHTAWLRVGGGADLWDQLGGELGVKALMVGHTGAGGGLYSEQPVEALADLRGRRIATRGLGREVVRALGAEPIQLDDHELAAALADRRVIAAEPFIDTGAAIAHWRATPGLHVGGMALSLGMRASFWQQLAPADRALIEGVAAAACAQSAAENAARGAMARIAAGARRWPVVTGIAASMNSAIVAASASAVSDLAAHDATARRIVDSYRAFHRLLADDPVLPALA